MRLRTEGDGPLVVQLPGLIGGVDLFAEARNRVARAGYRVAALDNTGDRGDDPAGGPLDWDRLAGEVVAGFDRLGADDAVVWGTSFGSQIALATAARHPERVRGLLLCFPPRPGWRPRHYLAAERWCRRRRRPERMTAFVFHAGFYTLSAWEFLVPWAAARLPRLARAAREAATPDRTVCDKLRLLLHDHPRLPPPERPVPTSIVAGSWDLVVTPSAASDLAAALPGARLRWLRFAGHGGAYSHPRRYARIVAEELARLTAPRKTRTGPAPDRP